jgi:hypothetical protein
MFGVGKVNLRDLCVKEYNLTQRRKGKKHAKNAEREFKISASSAKKPPQSLRERIQFHAKAQRKKHAKNAEREFKTSASSAKKPQRLCVKEYNLTQRRKGKNTHRTPRGNLKSLRTLRKTSAISA